MPPRWRVIISCLVMLVLGYAGLSIYNVSEGSLDCESTLVRAVNGCSIASGHLSFARGVLALVALLILAGLAVLLAVWALRPVQALTGMVERLGPQNLAERSPIHTGVDETTRLAVALNQMMDRLAAGYEGQRSFAANASHELRTPLAVQRTLIEVSMAGARTPDQVELLTDQLLATNERNERLIEGLLVLSESDRGLLVRTPLRLDEIAGPVIDAHRDLASRSGVTIRSDFSARVVRGEQVLLERLVTNLVRNAILYNVEGGQVTVTVGGDPALIVENSGAVIPAESVDGLFEPFRRGTADRTHHGGGAGLGLTIVRSIAAAHDGTMSARPGAQGGLRIAVALPGG